MLAPDGAEEPFYFFVAISGKRPEAKNKGNYSVFCTCDKSYKKASLEDFFHKEDGRNRPQASGDAKAGGEVPGNRRGGSLFASQENFI